MILVSEWLYVHSNDTQRSSLDLQFAEAIMNLDLSNLTVQELVEGIKEIKSNLVKQLCVIGRHGSTQSKTYLFIRLNQNCSWFNAT